MCGFFFGIGGLILVLGYAQTAVVLLCGQRVCAECIGWSRSAEEFVMRTLSDGTKRIPVTKLHPVFRFLNDEGAKKTVVYQAFDTLKATRFKVGEKVELLYLAANPPGSLVHHFFDLWIRPLVFSALFLVPGVILLAIDQ